MMRLVQVTDAVLNNPALPQLDYAALMAQGVVVPEFEDGAYADFCFDLTDARALQSRVSGPRLVPANTAPTFGVASLTVPSGGLNGLVSPLSDAGSKTIVAVVQRPTNPTAVAVIAQTSMSGTVGGPDDNGLFMFFTTLGNVGATLRVTGTDTFMTPTTVTGTSVGDWFFVAYSETKNGSNYDARLWVGKAAGPVTATATGVARRESSRTVAFGNAYDTTANYSERAMLFHRAMLFQRALSDDELAALYARARVVAARRGITVV